MVNPASKSPQLIMPTDSDVSTASNEASILSSLNNLLPSAAFRALVACVFALALLLYVVRKMSLSKATEDMHATMFSTEWLYYHSAEAGLVTQWNEDIYDELTKLRTKASFLREQSLRASLSFWDRPRAFCRGLSLEIMRCTKDVKTLKIRIEIAREEGSRSINKKQAGHRASFLFTTPNHPRIAQWQCSCKL
ncbi:hypothetical protein C8R44DRAFT_853183 [Mycena epipterygia]|nr:hypothetical protein C8R44DRAFT_853183 [Mycena epipterygia]